MPVFSVHASWLSDDAIPESAVRNVAKRFRPDDELLCPWIDEKNPRRFIVSFDLQSTDYLHAARDCFNLVTEVAALEPRMGLLEEVGAADEEGYLIVESEDFPELSASD